MASSGSWITPLVRYRINRDSLKQDMQEDADIELGELGDVDTDFGATLKDTINVVNNDNHRTREKKTVLVLSDNNPPLRLPKFLKIRVYWARLLGWWFGIIWDYISGRRDIWNVWWPSFYKQSVSCSLVALFFVVFSLVLAQVIPGNKYTDYFRAWHLPPLLE